MTKSKPPAKSASKAKPEKPVEGLVGLFGHSYGENGHRVWQFEIVRKLTGDRYAIQLFSWMDGRDTEIKIVTEDELCSPKYKLYSSRAEWLFMAQKYSADGEENPNATPYRED